MLRDSVLSCGISLGLLGEVRCSFSLKIPRLSNLFQFELEFGQFLIPSCSMLRKHILIWLMELFTLLRQHIWIDIHIAGNLGEWNIGLLD